MDRKVLRLVPAAAEEFMRGSRSSEFERPLSTKLNKDILALYNERPNK